MQQLAKHIHDVARRHGSIQHLRADVEKLDRLFHHIEDLVGSITQQVDRRAAVHFGLVMRNISGTLHHLRDDLASSNRTSGYRWTHYCYFPKYRCLGYYCPQARCWYYYYAPYRCFFAGILHAALFADRHKEERQWQSDTTTRCPTTACWCKVTGTGSGCQHYAIASQSGHTTGHSWQHTCPEHSRAKTGAKVRSMMRHLGGTA